MKHERDRKDNEGNGETHWRRGGDHPPKDSRKREVQVQDHGEQCRIRDQWHLHHRAGVRECSAASRAARLSGDGGADGRSGIRARSDERGSERKRGGGMMETREITVTIHREPEKRDDLLATLLIVVLAALAFTAGYIAANAQWR